MLIFNELTKSPKIILDKNIFLIYIDTNRWHDFFLIEVMIEIKNVLIDEKIASTSFSCDLQKCKGACCTLPGGSGAPLLNEEIREIERSYKAAKKYMRTSSLKLIEANGFFEGEYNDYSTKCINNKDCVFVFYENDVAKCALETAYHNNESEFRKPLSCHLFPIRLGNFNGPYIYYDKFEECNPALEKGKKENISMIESVKDALIRKFGVEFYNELQIHLKGK